MFSFNNSELLARVNSESELASAYCIVRVVFRSISNNLTSNCDRLTDCNRVFTEQHLGGYNSDQWTNAWPVRNVLGNCVSVSTLCKNVIYSCSQRLWNLWNTTNLWPLLTYHSVQRQIYSRQCCYAKEGYRESVYMHVLRVCYWTKTELNSWFVQPNTATIAKCDKLRIFPLHAHRCQYTLS